MLGHIGSVTCRAALPWSCSLQVLPTSITLPVSCSVRTTWPFFWTTVRFLLFWGRSVHLSQHLNTMGNEGFFNCLNSSFLTYLLRDTKICPKTTPGCLLVPCCPPPTPLASHSGGEHLPTKMFSCMNVSHILGGFSAGENAFSHPY